MYAHFISNNKIDVLAPKKAQIDGIWHCNLAAERNATDLYAKIGWYPIVTTPMPTEEAQQGFHYEEFYELGEEERTVVIPIYHDYDGEEESIEESSYDGGLDGNEEASYDLSGAESSDENEEPEFETLVVLRTVIKQTWVEVEDEPAIEEIHTYKKSYLAQWFYTNGYWAGFNQLLSSSETARFFWDTSTEFDSNHPMWGEISMGIKLGLGLSDEQLESLLVYGEHGFIDTEIN